MSTSSKKSELAIVMGFYNGNDYIEEQISSIFNQSFQNFDLLIFDDNSTQDFLLENLSLNKTYLKRITFIKRDINLGYAKNFLYGLKSLENYYDYYAFSDQDDIWHKDKLKEAIKYLNKFPDETPTLYGGRTELIGGKKGGKLGKSKLFKRKPSFQNAIIQNIFGGNTMVFNKSAYQVIAKSIFYRKIISHDWWCYQLISGVGGEIIYDQRIFTKYRQHNRNLIGSNISLKSKYIRLSKVMKNEFRNQNDNNLEALNINSNLLTDDNNKSLKAFTKSRRYLFPKNIFYFIKSGVYRQTIFENIALYIGILFRKI